MRQLIGGTALPDPLEVVLARDALIEALHAVAGGGRDAEPLKSALTKFRLAAGAMSEGDVVWSMAELVETLALAVKWTAAAWNAEPDAMRYATATRLRARQVLAHEDARWPSGLREAAQELGTLESFDVPAEVAVCLSTIPLPPRLTNLYRPSNESHFVETESEPVTLPTVAILVRLQGEPVMRPTVVRPGALHQFEIEARASHWPEAADQLEIAFLSVHPRDFLYVSGARFAPDELLQPLEVRVAGERPPYDPPLELTARAAFLLGDEARAARLVGNTTLEIVTFDPNTALPLDMSTAAPRLQQMMSELGNALPDLDISVRRDARLLLEATMRFSHTVLDDRLGKNENPDEKWFQRELQQFLQADPQIGARLDIHARRAGGWTDLTLGDMILELKVVRKAAISGSSRFSVG